MIFWWWFEKVSQKSIYTVFWWPQAVVLELLDLGFLKAYLISARNKLNL